MSAFRGKADMLFAPQMSAFDPKRTFARYGSVAVSGVQDRNPDAHVFCAPATPVVDSVSDPVMSFGHIADVDAAVAKRHGILVAVIDPAYLDVAVRRCCREWPGLRD
jgi:hypothetical protein